MADIKTNEGLRDITGVIAEIKKSRKLSVANKDALLRFYNEKLATGSMKKSTMYYKLKNIKRLGENVSKDFKEMTREDLVQFFNELTPLPRRSPLTGKSYVVKSDYSQYSLWFYKQIIKSFFRWLYEGDAGVIRDRYGSTQQVSWIKGSTNKLKEKYAKEVLTREEILTLLKSTKNKRDKAIIALLFETGLRAGEMLAMKRADINFHDDFAEFKVDGKTGERMVLAIFSYPYLKQWLEQLDNDKDYLDSSVSDYVWPAYKRIGEKNFTKLNYSRVMTSFSLYEMIGRAVRRAGIKKHICTHALRHSSATDFAKQGYTETEMRIKYGWTPASNMVSRYSHFKYDDLKQKVLFKAGKNPAHADQMQPLNLAKHCPFCSHENPFENEYCGKCAKPLNINRLKEYEKANAAYTFTSKVITNLTQLEKKGLDVQKFNEFMQQWVRQETKE